MRLFEVEQMCGKLPSQAGKAKLKWAEESPSRKGELIKLTLADEAQFFPLCNGDQFLFQLPGRDLSQTFFGGTDEQPFLVELYPHVVSALYRGEAGFFDAIKPQGAKILEQAFGTKAVRQGDWFAVPFPFSWKVVCGMTAFVQPNPKVIELEGKGKGIQLSETRHTLTAEKYLVLPERRPLGCWLIGEGVLRSPDHEDLIIEGPHAFFQTAHLVHPHQAD